MNLDIRQLGKGSSGVLSASAQDALSRNGLTLDAEQLAEIETRKDEAMWEARRFEIKPVTTSIVIEAFAGSPFLTREDVGTSLGNLVELFVALRSEASLDFGDEELAAALRSRFDQLGGETWALDVEELAATLRIQTNGFEPYRIVDEEGREYVFDPEEWEYNEQAAGWDGEEWDHDFD